MTSEKPEGTHERRKLGGDTLRCLGIIILTARKSFVSCKLLWSYVPVSENLPDPNSGTVKTRKGFENLTVFVTRRRELEAGASSGPEKMVNF